MNTDSTDKISIIKTNPQLTLLNSKIKYSIYSGAGNDFVMIDNRSNIIQFSEQKSFTEKICKEYFPEIDGVIFVDNPLNKGSIRMNYYNRDGSYGAMCGNGARCISKFAADNGILTSKDFLLEAVDNVYKVEIINDNNIRIGFPPPLDYKLNLKNSINIGKGNREIETHWMAVGSEHIIVYIDELQNKEVLGIDNLDNAKINEWGKILRFHKDFAPKGGNVSFVQVLENNKVRIRTYERGVERKTLA
jgi:diaminopimelate epimerase